MFYLIFSYFHHAIKMSVFLVVIEVRRVQVERGSLKANDMPEFKWGEMINNITVTAPKVQMAKNGSISSNHLKLRAGQTLLRLG